MKRRSIATIAACIALWAPHDARAAGWAVGEASIVAGGTGGAGTARAGSAGAAWYNPAALADGKGLRAAIGILLAAPSISASGAASASVGSTEARVKTPPHLFASFAHGRWAAGLSLTVPFGSGVAWPRDWAGRFESVASSVQIWRFSPFFAWRFGRVRVAAGLQIDIGLLAIERQLDFVDVEGGVDIQLSGVGVGGHASIFVEVARWLALGLTYKSRTRIGLDGTAQFGAPLAFADRTPDQAASSSITLPDLLSFGAAVTPHPRVRIAVDFGVAFWSVLDTIAVDFSNPSTTDTTLTPRWQTRPWVRGGAEVITIERRLTLRAGLFYDPSPAPAATLAPNSPDSNRFGVTAGASVRLFNALWLDAFYGHVRLLGNTTTSTEALPASYSGHIHLVGLGLRFGA